MKKTTFLLVAVFLTFSGRAAMAQSLAAEIKSQLGAPVMITSAECSPPSGGGSSCVARFTVGQSDIVAAGFRWVFTYADGSHTTLRQFFDATLGNKIAYRAGENGDSGRTGAGAGVKSADGTPLKPVKASVELEFVVPGSGKPWGNLQSPTYWQMLGQRQGYRQAAIMMKSAYGKGGLPALLKELDMASSGRCCGNP